jgi:hypothetical protein
MNLITQFFTIFFGVLNSLLAIRFILIFFRITLSPLTDWLYGFTGPVVSAFGILPSFNFFGFYFETPTLLAVIVFSIISYFVNELAKGQYSGNRR